MKKLNMIILGVVMVMAIFIADLVRAADFSVTNAVEFHQALATAANNNVNDTIILSAGTYNGGFEYQGQETNSLTIIAEGTLTPDQVILDGGGSNEVLLLDDNGYNSDFTIEGITIRNGFRGYDYSSYGSAGVSVYASGGTNKFIDNIIKINTNGGNGNGGGVYVTSNGGITTFKGNDISGNSCRLRGGGVFVNLQNGGEIEFSTNTIKENTSNYSGGGVYVYLSSGTLKFEKNFISGNLITGSGLDGGGVYAESTGGEIIFTHNTITENSCVDEGGGVYVKTNLGSIALINNIFAENSCNVDGGGVYAYGDQGTLILTNNTITGNVAARNGGGLYNNVLINTTSQIYNNIIWNNSAQRGADIVLVGGGLTDGFNNDYHRIFGVWDSEGGNIHEDPKFLDSVGGDYHLSSTPTSPCINAGNNSAPELPNFDMDGEQRIYLTVDQGADEYVGITPPTAAFSCSVKKGPPPLEVIFTDESIGDIDSWYWVFGDGDTSTDTNPTHTYIDSNIYEVTLTVANVAGDSNAADYILVFTNPPIPDITVNTGDGPIIISPGDQATIEIAFDPTDLSGPYFDDRCDVIFDYWIAALTPMGAFWYRGDRFMRSNAPIRLHPTVAADKLNLTATEILDHVFSIAGIYTFYFVVDNIVAENPNDSIFDDMSWYDSVDVYCY